MTARTYRALLIANSTFPDDVVNLPELEGPRNDAALLRDALCDRDFGLFPPDNVRLVQERTMADILRETEDFLSSATREDITLLYYSGHGVLDQSDEFFLCARNTRRDRLRSTAIKASDVSKMIDQSAAAASLVFLDCCYSGRFKGGDVPRRFGGEGRFVMTSTRGRELARDADSQNHASLFTHYLVEGLLGRADDHDNDGVVNLGDLYGYVHDALRDTGRQVPQKRFEGSGDVPIALRAGKTSPAAEGSVSTLAEPVPVFDLSASEIDLGRIGADEVLPPERVLVINRGGGSLAWTVESSATWVAVEADAAGFDLHLHPGSGVNRANIYVTDVKSGILKTVRIRVRVDAPFAAMPSTPARPRSDADAEGNSPSPTTYPSAGEGKNALEPPLHRQRCSGKFSGDWAAKPPYFETCAAACSGLCNC